MLALWIAFAPVGADAQEVRVHDSSRSARPLLLVLPESAHTIPQRPNWMISTRSPAGDNAASVLRAQDPRSPRPDRGVGRKILGAAVGATAGFFAGGYLGAAIEGDRCNCDDPGLMGALIGAPVGATAGGILGWHFLF
jgi:hypothetical protein